MNGLAFAFMRHYVATRGWGEPHRVQSFYDPRGAWDQASGGGDHYWLDEAASVWLESRYTDTANYVSEARDGCEYIPFEGAENGLAGSGLEQPYGYGMSALLTDLLAPQLANQPAGDAEPVAIYERILAGRMPFEAIEAVFETTMPEAWEEFSVNYAAGEIMPDVTRTLLKTSRSGAFDVRTEADTLRIFNDGWKKLSGRVYTITLEYADLNENSSLRVDATGGAPSVCRKRGSRSSKCWWAKVLVDDPETERDFSCWNAHRAPTSSRLNARCWSSRVRTTPASPSTTA
jgi:hypothetical protein